MLASRILCSIGMLAACASLGACAGTATKHQSSRIVPDGAHVRLLEQPRVGSRHTATIATGTTPSGRPFTITAILRPSLFAHQKGAPKRHADVNVEISGQESGGCFSGDEETIASCTSCGSHEVALSGPAPAGSASVRVSVRGAGQYEATLLTLPSSVLAHTQMYLVLIPTAHPVITHLTALDAHGRILAAPSDSVVATGKVCTNAPSQPVKFLPHGIRLLVHGALPTGGGFSIVAERYRFQGRIYFDLSAGLQRSVVRHEEFQSGGGSSFSPTQSTEFFPFSQMVACSRHPVILLWGLLRASSDTVLVGSGGKPHPLARVMIPADLDAGGELAYGLLKSASTLIVKNSAGKTVEEHRLDAPPGRRSCTGGSESITYFGD
ncbi:MAG TPA: hypothetical protein VID48_15400 [Solirubrobacteraceae bacterium]